MRQLVLKMSVSIDGFVGGPDGQIDWIFRSMDPEAAAWTVAQIRRAGVHIMGRRTYHDMAAYWPTSTEPFAPPMNEIPKVVFSKEPLGTAGETTAALADAKRAHPIAAASAASAEWAQSRVARGDLATEIMQLKQESGGVIIAHGGASFAQSLVRLGLIDEFWLLAHPVALGRGLPLFGALSSPIDLELVSATAFAGGTVGHVYRPRRS